MSLPKLSSPAGHADDVILRRHLRILRFEAPRQEGAESNSIEDDDDGADIEGAVEGLVEVDDDGEPLGVVLSRHLKRLRHGFLSWPPPRSKVHRARIAALEDDCLRCFDGETSFWLPATAIRDHPPLCALEALAGEIFAYHAKGCDYDPRRSGAEWWVQVRKAGDTHGLAMHADKDEDLVDALGLNVHPAASTVTYITGDGAPTFVLAARPHPKHDEAFEQPITRAWLSVPAAGKHIAFGGTLLHGVGPFSRAAEGRDWSRTFCPRVTFLVNVWLNHVPIDLTRFPCPERLEQPAPPAFLVEGSPLAPLWWGRAPQAPIQVAIREERQGSVYERWPIRTGVPHTLSFPYSLGAIQDAAMSRGMGGGRNHGRSICVTWEPGLAAIVEGDDFVREGPTFDRRDHTPEPSGEPGANGGGGEGGGFDGVIWDAPRRDDSRRREADGGGSGWPEPGPWAASGDGRQARGACIVAVAALAFAYVTLWLGILPALEEEAGGALDAALGLPRDRFPALALAALGGASVMAAVLVGIGGVLVTRALGPPPEAKPEEG